MKKRVLSCVVVLFFALLPYAGTVAVNGAETALLSRVPDVEEYLPWLLFMQISSEYEEETLQAQAVIARTNFYRKFLQEENLPEIIQEIKGILKDRWDYWKIPWEVYEAAVWKTTGQILIHDGELKPVPYHEISAGVTRNGEEAFHDSAYTYLKSVDSSFDKNSPDYLNSTYISQQQLPTELNIEERDSAGHIISLRTEDSLLEGEAFRQGMGLSSSNFSIQKIGDEFRFLCKGKGHGLGFSQYGGNEMAKEGNTFDKILKKYFPEMELAHISGIFAEK